MSVQHTLPADIERTSMQIIEEELNRRGIPIPGDRAAVVRRVIHTTADFDYAETLHFTKNAVAQGIEALKAGAPLVTDTNMALAGISKPSLAALGLTAHCYMADPEVAQAARQGGTTRAVAAMRHAARTCPKAVFAIGNAPTALLALCLYVYLLLRSRWASSTWWRASSGCLPCVRKKACPALRRWGAKGGSTVAAAICNALLYSATDRLDPTARGWQG